jgi:shikimate kinase
MGCGKTYLLNKLKKSHVAELNNIDFFDLDNEIIASGCDYLDIESMVKARGWNYFRELEKNTFIELITNHKKNHMLISLGGGALSKEFLKYINERENIKLIFLSTPFEICWERIYLEGHRPLVKKGKLEVEKLYKNRLSLYQSAQIYIDVNEQNNISAIDDLLKLSNS